MRWLSAPRGLAQRTQAGTEMSSLVVREDDDGDHGSLVVWAWLKAAAGR